LKILIGVLAAFVGVLPDRYCELAWHGTNQKRSLNPGGLRLHNSKLHHATRLSAAVRLGAVRTCVA
jgi:hypothetical protein